MFEHLSQIKQAGAWCGLGFKEHNFQFQSMEQMTASAERLQEDNIHEELKKIAGEFQGVLPASRRFEFKRSEGGGIIRGKVGLEIEDADILNREYLHKPVSIELQVLQVGQGRPRYTLLKQEAISDAGRTS